MIKKVGRLKAGELTLPKLTGKNAGVSIIVQEDRDDGYKPLKIGELYIGKGSVKWVPAGYKFGNRTRVTWDKFADIMDKVEKE